jgi:hypothetical protein
VSECIGTGCPNEREGRFEWCVEHMGEICRQWAEQVARDVEEGNTQ